MSSNNQNPLADKAMQRWADADLEGNLEKAWELEAQAHPIGRVGLSQVKMLLIWFIFYHLMKQALLLVACTV